MGVWTNADKPEEAAQARSYGAAGHRPLPDRAHVPRGRAARDRPRRDPRRDAGDPGEGQDAPRASSSTSDELEDVATFDAAMAKLEVLQQGDFEGIFKAMDGLPVVIRLIDPPLHEFLPNLEEQLVKVTIAEEHGGATRRGQGAPRDDQEPPRAEPDARAARLPPGADDPGLREDPDPGDPQRPDRGQEGRRQPDREDHDPARRPRERAGGDAGAPREGGDGGPRGGRRRRGRLQVRDDDRGPARRADRRRDRPRGRLLQLRHERPDPDDVRLQPRRRRGRLPAEVRRGQDPAGQPVPDARRRGRRADEDRRRQGPLDEARTSSSGSAASTAATRSRSPSASAIGLDYVSCSPFRVPVARLAAAQAALAGAAERDK